MSEFNGIPFIAVSNEELAAGDDVAVGDFFECRCGQTHVIEGSAGSAELLYYKCDKQTFLAGIEGKTLSQLSKNGRVRKRNASEITGGEM